MTKFTSWVEEKTPETELCYAQHTFTLEADHGLVDERGRKVGGFAVVAAEMEQAPSAKSGYDYGSYKPTGRWQVRIYATRGGKKFGAIPRSTSYADLSIAKSNARAKLLEQGKRYARTYGPHKMKPATSTYRVVTASRFLEHLTVSQVELEVGRKLTPLEQKAIKSWPVGDTFRFGNVSVIREN